MTRQDQWLLLDKHRRKLYIKYEIKRTVLRSVVRNTRLPLSARYLANLHLSMLPWSSAPGKPRRRCVVTGRQHNVLKRTRYSRFVLRAEAYRGFLPGARRFSW